MITRGDVLSVHPFGNAVLLREYSGAQLLAALEHGVSGENARGPQLLQTAGLRYEVDGSLPAGRRVRKAEVLDAQGRATPLEPEGRYVTALADFLADGGDGYAMLKQGRAVSAPDPLVADVVENYLKTHNPLPEPRVGRLTRLR